MGAIFQKLFSLPSSFLKQILCSIQPIRLYLYKDGLVRSIVYFTFMIIITLLTIYAGFPLIYHHHHHHHHVHVKDKEQYCEGLPLELTVATKTIWRIGWSISPITGHRCDHYHDRDDDDHHHIIIITIIITTVIIITII